MCDFNVIKNINLNERLPDVKPCLVDVPEKKQEAIMRAAKETLEKRGEFTPDDSLCPMITFDTKSISCWILLY